MPAEATITVTPVSLASVDVKPPFSVTIEVFPKRPEVGESVLITSTWRKDGQLADPDLPVHLHVLRPDGTIDGDFYQTRKSTGVFTHTYETAATRTHLIQLQSDEEVPTIAEAEFHVMQAEVQV